jgi:hypothetical protein
MEEAKLAILTDAKQEYSLQLLNILKTPICTGLKFLYDESKKKCISENRFNEVLAEFQDYLSQVRLWSQDMIENEYHRIEDESGCDFIKELITAVFMSHTQILQAIRNDNYKSKQTQIDVPKPEHFIHKCYINSAREFYKNPFFFYDGPEISPIERQKNIPQCESIIATAISETIRQLLPVRRILKTYLQDTFNQEQYDEETKKESMKGVSQSYQNNLREIVKREIANYKDPNNESIIENLIQTGGVSKDELFEQLPELSMDDIENIVKKQEEEDLIADQLEKKEKEQQIQINIEEKMVEEKMVEEKIVEEKMVEEKMVEEKMVEEKMVEEKMVEEKQHLQLNIESIEQSQIGGVKEDDIKHVVMDECSVVNNKKTKKEDSIMTVEKDETKMKLEEITPPISTEELINKPIEEINITESQPISLPTPTPVENINNNNIDERKMFADGLEFDEEIDLSDDISFDPPNKSTSSVTEKKYTFF